MFELFTNGCKWQHVLYSFTLTTAFFSTFGIISVSLGTVHHVLKKRKLRAAVRTPHRHLGTGGVIAVRRRRTGRQVQHLAPTLFRWLSSSPRLRGAQPHLEERASVNWKSCLFRGSRVCISGNITNPEPNGINDCVGGAWRQRNKYECFLSELFIHKHSKHMATYYKLIYKHN